MSAWGVTSQDNIATRAAIVRSRLCASGVNVSEWARSNGFEPKIVHAVLSGARACRRGKSHLIAVALGIKDAPFVEPLLEAAE